MSDSQPGSVSELAERVNGRVVGDVAVMIERVADLTNAGVGDIANLDNEKFFSGASIRSAACLIIPMDANANVVICHVGVCSGADGFGYVRDNMGYHKFPQIGSVVIEDNVELGAYTCVDRAALGRTRIGRGTKLDNMVHVGHNCNIGERVVIAAQTGISGSVVIEDDAVIGGQVGFGDHTRVQKGAVIGSKAGILPGKIVRPGVWWGIPIQPLADYKRMNAHIGRLPKMREDLKELKRQAAELNEKLSRLSETD